MIALSAVRAIHFAVAIQAIGALLFVWILSHVPEVVVEKSSRRSLARLAAVSAVAVVLSGIAWLVLQAAEMTGRNVADAWNAGAIGILLFKTQAGVIWWVHFALAAALLVDLCALACVRNTPSEAAVIASLALAVVNFISCAWLSHAGADPGPYGSLHLAVHASHMLAVSLWLGGFIPLSMLLYRARLSGDPKNMLVARHASVWFGNIALFSVGIIIATGTATTALLVDNMSDLTNGPFAGLLAVKLILFLSMLVLAATNRQWLVPQLTASANPSAAATRLWRSVSGELALGVLVLLIVGALGITSPGADAD
jgi:copper resistance protein D